MSFLGFPEGLPDPIKTLLKEEIRQDEMQMLKLEYDGLVINDDIDQLSPAFNSKLDALNFDLSETATFGPSSKVSSIPPILPDFGFATEFANKWLTQQPRYDSDPSVAAYIAKFVKKTVKQWGSLPVRGFNQRELTSKYSALRENDLLNMGDKLEIMVAKLVPRFGSFSFRSLPTNNGGKCHIIQIPDSAATTGASSPASKNTPSASVQCERASALYENRHNDRQSQSGGQSSTDCGEDNISQIPNPAATTGSLDPASPALNRAPSASDHSARASASSENIDNDGQPPPDRSPSAMELAEAPRQAEGRLQPSSVAKLCLVVNCELCLAPAQIRSNAGHSLTANANTLLLFVELFGVAGFILCLVAVFLQRKRKAAAVMTVMGCVAAVCGLLSILGTRFPEKVMLLLTVALWVLPVSASPFVLKEFV